MELTQCYVSIRVNKFVGAALNDAGLPGGLLVDNMPIGRPGAEFISENPQDSEIAAIESPVGFIAAEAAPTCRRARHE